MIVVVIAKKLIILLVETSKISNAIFIWPKVARKKKVLEKKSQVKESQYFKKTKYQLIKK